MADLTFLGDACFLWNSVVRYKNELIYSYSGLLCIAINPYKRFPIYTLRTMELYVGKRRSECSPHIFAIAEGAYQGMQNTGYNQAILQDSSSQGNLELEKLRIPRRSSLTLQPFVLLGRGQKERHLLRTR